MGFLIKNRVKSFARQKEIKNKSKFLRDAEKTTKDNLDNLAKRNKQKNIDELYVEDETEN